MSINSLYIALQAVKGLIFQGLRLNFTHMTFRGVRLTQTGKFILSEVLLGGSFLHRCTCYIFFSMKVVHGTCDQYHF